MLRPLLAICLIAGFAIGTGFLALPAIVGLSGFWGGLIAIILIWLLGVATGLLYIEAFLAVPEANHIFTLSQHLTGRFGKWFASFIFLFLSYALLIIGYILLYNLFYTNFEEYSKLHPSVAHLWMFFATLFFGILLYFGRTVTLGAITLLFLFFLLAFGYGIYSLDLFLYPKIALKPYFLFIIFALAAIFNFSFYHSVLPTVILFLKRGRTQLICAVWIGYTAAMFFLVLWLWITLRSDIYANFLAASATHSFFSKGFFFLAEIPQFKMTFRFIATCSVFVFILSAAISLMDFFLDALPTFGKYFLIALIFIPAWIISLFAYNHFMNFRTLATAITEWFLATLFPLLWVWKIRYDLTLPVRPILFGGKKMMVIMIFATVILFLILGTTPIHKMFL